MTWRDTRPLRESTEMRQELGESAETSASPTMFDVSHLPAKLL